MNASVRLPSEARQNFGGAPVRREDGREHHDAALIDGARDVVASVERDRVVVRGTSRDRVDRLAGRLSVPPGLTRLRSRPEAL